ncbi:MAG: glycosyltransferase [candidate division Zixibacteria bacterium]|nr:glycosyltransferase [candidate division Zixibacteria bacterium]
MKILLITHLLPYPPSGGVRIRNYNLLKEASKNNDIYMLTFYQQAHLENPEKFDQYVMEIKEYCKHLEVFEIPTDNKKLAWYAMLLLNIFSFAPYSDWYFRSKKMKHAIKQQIASNSFDVVEIGTIGLARYAKLAPDIPAVLVHHNIESALIYRRSKAVKNWFSKVYLLLQAWKLKRHEALSGKYIKYHTTCSEEDKTILAKHCPDANIAVVPNGVDIEYFQPDNDLVEKNSLVFAGGLNWFPNLDAMIYFKNDIWPILKSKIPNISMNLIGMKPGRELLEFSKKDESFKVLGFVDDVRPYIAKAAVYVVPIRVGGGTRLKILDAMAMGKAIVSDPIGCEGIDVSHGEDILTGATPQEFATHVIEILNNDEKRKKLEINARDKMVRKYSWTSIGPLLNDVYIRTAAIIN